MSEPTWKETITTEGSQLLKRVRELVEEGNVRRIVIKQHDRTLIELPLTVGVVGVLIAPVLAAVGALAALLSDCTIEVERSGEKAAEGSEPGPAGAAGPAGQGGPSGAGGGEPSA
jgi:hypothetical protein